MKNKIYESFDKAIEDISDGTVVAHSITHESLARAVDGRPVRFYLPHQAGRPFVS